MVVAQTLSSGVVIKAPVRDYPEINETTLNFNGSSTSPLATALLWPKRARDLNIESIAYMYHLSDYEVEEWVTTGINTAPLNAIDNRVNDRVRVIVDTCDIDPKYSNEDYEQFFAHVACSLRNDLSVKLAEIAPYTLANRDKAYAVAYEVVVLSFKYKRRLFKGNDSEFLSTVSKGMIGQLTKCTGISEDSAKVFVRNVLRDIMLK